LNALVEMQNISGEVIPPATGLYAAVAAQMDKSISTARAFPRNLSSVGKTLANYVTADLASAEACLYSLERDGPDGKKIIQGPSVRFAEMLAYAYGHLKVDARVVEETKDFIIVRGEAHDLERNVSFSQDVARRISGRSGRRYSNDMIAVTAMAAASIAQRNCILKVVPSFIWASAFEAARSRVGGDHKTLAERRIKAVGQFSVLGVSADQILRKLGIRSIGEITAEHLIHLVGTFQAIRDGESSVEAEFGDTRSTAGSLGGSPLAAREDGSDEQVSADSTHAAHVAPDVAAPHPPPVPMAGGQLEEPPPQKAKPGPKTDAAAVHPDPARDRAPGFPHSAAVVTEKEAWTTEQRLDAYERECVSAKTPDDLKAIAARWGGTGYLEEMTDNQKTRFDDIYDASLRALQLQARNREGDQAKQAYEASRNGAGGDSARPAPKQPEPPKAAQRRPQAVNGGEAFAPEIEALRPTDPEAIPVWEECVRFLQAGENNADVAKRMTELSKQERFLSLPEPDQLQMRNVGFKIRKTKPF
jgi:hypothetical protein